MKSFEVIKDASIQQMYNMICIMNNVNIGVNKITTFEKEKLTQVVLTNGDVYNCSPEIIQTKESCIRIINQPVNCKPIPIEDFFPRGMEVTYIGDISPQMGVDMKSEIVDIISDEITNEIISQLRT